MRSRALTSLLLMGLTLTALAQTPYKPLEVGSKPEKATAKPAKLAVWSANPKMLAQLAPEKPLFSWAIRPPKGFVSTQKSDDGSQIFIFQGDPRKDNSAPVLWVVMGDVRPPEDKKTREEILMDMYMIQLHENRTNWIATDLEIGSLHGRKFLRRRWSAEEDTNGVIRHVHGAVYLTVIGARYVAVTIQDTSPGAASTMPMMETAALTLHKR